MRSVENALLQLVLRYRARRGRPREDLALRYWFTRPEAVPTPRSAPLYPDPPTQLAFLWRVLKGVGSQTLRLGKASYRLATESETAREARRKRAREVNVALRADPAKGPYSGLRRAVWIGVVDLIQRGRDGVMRRLRGRKGQELAIVPTAVPTTHTQSDSLLLDKAQ